MCICISRIPRWMIQCYQQRVLPVQLLYPLVSYCMHTARIWKILEHFTCFILYTLIFRRGSNPIFLAAKQERHAQVQTIGQNCVPMLMTHNGRPIFCSWLAPLNKCNCAWASFKICKIASYEWNGNAGNDFSATAGKRSRRALRHVCDARVMTHAGSLTSGFLSSDPQGRFKIFKSVLSHPMFVPWIKNDYS